MAIHKRISWTFCKYNGCNYKTKHPDREYYQHDYNMHLLTHKGKQLPHKCPWLGCENTFTTSGNMKEHTLCHTDEYRYSCSWPGCDRTFKTNKGLNNHLPSHTGEKHLSCDWPACEYRTHRSMSLKSHK